MAQTSGNGGRGGLILGGIAGTAVVLGGVVLFQLGVFSTSGSEGSNGAAGQDASATEGAPFTGDGAESGQPLQNNGLLQPRNSSAGSEQEERAAAESAGTTAEPDNQQPALAEDPAQTPQLSANEASDAATDQAASELAETTALLDQQPDTAVMAEAEKGFVLAPPQLDLVRVDNEGAAVIAGRAQAGVRISVLLDGEILDQLDVPAGGAFVSLTQIAPQPQAQVISLLAEHDGQRILSDASFIVAPVGTVAAAEPAPLARANNSTPEQPGETQVGEATPATGPASDPSRQPEQKPVETAQANPDADPSQSAASIQQEEPQPVTGSEAQQADAAQATDSTDATAAATPSQAQEPVAPQPQSPAVAVLRADENGVQVIQPAVPADPALRDEIALDSISYNGTGGVELSGRSRPGSTVRVYVDNTPVAELEASGEGRWTGRLEGVDPGIYTLRLDEIELASGDVVSRLETPFKREAPEALLLPAGDTAPDQPVPLVRAVTVQKGDTLWAISQQKYGSGFLYVRLFEANKGAIRNPDLIYPGQVFTIPD